jgi:hypothetical protein
LPHFEEQELLYARDEVGTYIDALGVRGDRHEKSPGSIIVIPGRAVHRGRDTPAAARESVKWRKLRKSKVLWLVLVIGLTSIPAVAEGSIKGAA